MTTDIVTRRLGPPSARRLGIFLLAVSVIIMCVTAYLSFVKELP